MMTVTEAEMESGEAVVESNNTKKVNGTKRYRLVKVIGEITRNIDHAFKFNDCVIDKLQSDLKSNNSAAVEYMRSRFDTMLQAEDFLNWLSVAVGLKPYCLRMLLSENRPNKCNSKLPQSGHQDTHNF